MQKRGDLEKLCVITLAGLVIAALVAGTVYEVVATNGCNNKHCKCGCQERIDKLEEKVHVLDIRTKYLMNVIDKEETQSNESVQ